MENLIVVNKDELRDLVREAIRDTETEFDYIPINEAAQLLGTTKSAIYTLVHLKKLPAHKIGRRLYFSKKELAEHINRNKV